MTLSRRTFLTGSAAAVAAPWRFLDPAPTVTVKQGVLRGANEKGLRVFKGVPFAKPPVGPLRFRPPQPPEGWPGVRDALRNAPVAMQGESGSEDCLYLNVWAPPEGGSYPVFVWIHGGGNSGGGTAGQSGAGFAREGIVVVTVAYRLGSFGFLELGDVLGPEYAESGDNGIRDLEAALRWVRENIHAFGGDPDQVVIAGQSAGAKDVAALLAAKSAHGLFARAIMESGSGQTVHDRNSAREVTQGLLTALGLPESQARQLLMMPGEAIMEGQRRMEASYPHDFPFRPFVGGRYLPKRPTDLVDGRTPLLLGTCRDESIAFMPRADADKPIRSREVTNLPFDRAPEMESRYRAAFPNDSDLERRVRLLTAEEYWIPSVRFAEAHARRGGQTWMYRFDHANDGFAGHGGELAYTWNSHPGWTMHETWTAFIKGVPPAWPRYDAKERATLIYGQDGSTSVVSDPRGDERRLWDHML